MGDIEKIIYDYLLDNIRNEKIETKIVLGYGVHGSNKDEPIDFKLYCINGRWCHEHEYVSDITLKILKPILNKLSKELNVD